MFCIHFTTLLFCKAINKEDFLPADPPERKRRGCEITAYEKSHLGKTSDGLFMVKFNCDEKFNHV